jgi:endonuclease YncB( thermonuclease family)
MKRIILFCVALAAAFAHAQAKPINVNAIVVVDGDTIDVGPQRFRLVGFDTPEISTPRRKVSADERALASLARQRFVELLHSGPLDLTEVACSCPATTLGTKECNHGRKCGVLLLNGKNIGDTLIAEELAMPFRCGATRCPKMPDWPAIIGSQFPRGKEE